MPVSDKDVAVRRGDDARRSIERVVRGARDAGSTERHEHLAFGAELDDDVTLAVFSIGVRNEDIALAVDVDAVREYEEPRAEASHELAGRIELEDRRQARAGARVRATALEYPHVISTVDGDGTRRAPRPVELRPTVFGRIRRAFVRNARSARRVRACGEQCNCRTRGNDRSQRLHHGDPLLAVLRIVSVALRARSRAAYVTDRPPREVLVHAVGACMRQMPSRLVH